MAHNHDMKLTPRQARFVSEYLVDLNATQSAIRAGYSARTAEQQGPRLLGNVGVQAAIARRQKVIIGRIEVTQERVIEEFARIAFANSRDAATWNEGSFEAVPSDKLDERTASAVKSVTLRRTISYDKNGNSTERLEQRIDMHDKVKALDALARYLGMFVDRTEHTWDAGRLEAMAARVAAEFGVEADGLLEEAKRIAREQWESAAR